MIELPCTDRKNLTSRWNRCKDFFRETFWKQTEQFVLNGLKKMIEEIIEQEVTEAIGAEHSERTPKRKSKRNGYRWRSLKTRYGKIERICIPRARDLGIRFTLFGRWQRVEDSVLDAMLESYLLSRSGSSAQRIIEGFGQGICSRSFLQKLAHRFEEDLRQWHQRPILKNWPYVFIDGMAVRVKELFLSQWVVLWALGMDENHNKEILGFVVVKTESQEAVEQLLRDLKDRGLKSPKLIIRDDSVPIEKAASMVFPHTPQQSCIFHKVKAAGRYLKHTRHKKTFLREAADVYLKAENKRSAFFRARHFYKKWRLKEPRAVKALLWKFETTLSYFRFPKAHWTWIRTNNPLERTIEDVRSWTRRFGYFQGLANLEMALFTFISHYNNEVVPSPFKILSIQKDTLLLT